MEEFLAFFENMPPWQKLAWIFICISLNWIIEAGAPLFKIKYDKWKHALVNLVFLSCSIIINLFFGLATVSLFLWLDTHQFGLFDYINLPVWAELLLAIALLDFIAQYVAHYLLHKVKWMWKFHMVHHSDTVVDVTTGTRHHPGDYALREVFALIAIVITGMPISYYLVYRIASVFFTYLTHANINLPPAVDKAMSWVFITPNMHKFHHHFERPWTDTNYGNIFSFWDRIFGTLVYDDPRKVVYGLDVLDDSRDKDLAYQFKVPFDNTIKTDY